MAASIAHVLGQSPGWTSDAVLLERYVQQRDEDAFASLVSRHGSMVLGICRRMLGDVHAAEDAFQAVFLILARKAQSLKQPDSLPAWLYGVARRVALKSRTKSTRRPSQSFNEALPDSRPDPLAQLSARELLDIFDAEVQRLPVAQRSVFVLCCLEGHTQEEAARILGCTPGSIIGVCVGTQRSPRDVPSQTGRSDDRRADLHAGRLGHGCPCVSRFRRGSSQRPNSARGRSKSRRYRQAGRADRCAG